MIVINNTSRPVCYCRQGGVNGARFPKFWAGLICPRARQVLHPVVTGGMEGAAVVLRCGPLIGPRNSPRFHS